MREGVALSGKSRSVGRFPDHTMPANHLWAMLGAVQSEVHRCIRDSVRLPILDWYRCCCQPLPCSCFAIPQLLPLPMPWCRLLCPCFALPVHLLWHIVPSGPSEYRVL